MLYLYIIGEDVTNHGRIDLAVKIDNSIYIIEFKVDGAGQALQQIKEKNYHEKYLAENKTIYLVGIDFDSDSKGVANFSWEQV